MTIRQVYTFDLTTREYISSYMRDDSEITQLIGDRTFDALPSPVEGKAITRNEQNTAWLHIVDHRSKKQYSIVDGTESSVDYIGEIQKGYTLIPRPNAYSIFNKTKKQWIINEKLRLADLKIQQSETWDKAKQARDARIDAVDLIMLKNGHTYQVDGVTYLKLVSALTTANALDFTDDALLFDNFINIQNKETNLYKADLVSLITEKLAIEKKIRAFYTELRNEISSTATHEALALLSINFD